MKPGRAWAAPLDVLCGGLRHTVGDLASVLVVDLQIGVGHVRLAGQVARQRLPPSDTKTFS